MNMTKEIDGEECISAGAVILMAGIAAYHGDSEEQREKGQASLNVLLRAAAVKGYPSWGILRTLLQDGENSDRVRDMCHEAAGVIGAAGMIEALRSVGIDLSGEISDYP